MASNQANVRGGRGGGRAERPAGVRRRPYEHASHLFAVTVPYAEMSKEDVFECLQDVCERLLVSEERHFDGRVHHHIYIRTIERMKRKQVREIVNLIYGIVNDDDDDDDQEDNTSDHEEACMEGRRYDDSYLEDVVARHGIHITKIRSERNYLKYITKSDREPLFKNIEPTKLSFFFQANKWARHTPEYDPADSFVLNHPQFYNLLRQVHASIRSKELSLLKQPLRVFTRRAEDMDTEEAAASSIHAHQNEVRDHPAVSSSIPVESEVEEAVSSPPVEAASVDAENVATPFESLLATREWKQKVIDWWNDWVTNGYEPKKKQLYLWGPSNTGKSHFIKTILKECIPVPPEEDQQNPNAYERHVFKPTPNDLRFAWEEFDERLHSVMIINEFDFEEFCLSDLKKAFEGDSLVIGCKHTKSKRIRFQIPIIVISNMDIPDEKLENNYKYIGMRTRFNIVDTKFGLRYKN